MTSAGWNVVTADLRGTGATAYARDKIGRAPDHNTAEWSMWIGRPLLGQWVNDVRRLLDVLTSIGTGLPETTAVIGVGPASLVALCAAALDSRIDRVATVNGLASYVSDKPYEKQRMGIMAPGILRDVGDVPHLATMCAPRKVVVAGGVNGAGQTLSVDELTKNYEYTYAAYNVAGAKKQLQILGSAKVGEVVKALS